MILIIRTAPDNVFRLALEYAGAADVCVLLQPSLAQRYREEHPGLEILTFARDGMFDLSRLDRRQLRELRGRAFEKVVLLYNSPDRFSYSHLEEFAAGLGGGETIGMLPDGSTVTLAAKPRGSAGLIFKYYAARAFRFLLGSDRRVSLAAFLASLWFSHLVVMAGVAVTRPVAAINRRRFLKEAGRR